MRQQKLQLKQLKKPICRNNRLPHSLDELKKKNRKKISDYFVPKKKKKKLCSQEIEVPIFEIV